MSKRITKQQKDFAEKAAKQFAVLKEADEDLEALLAIRQCLENSNLDDPLIENKGRAIMKSIIVVLAAIYEENKQGIPLILDTMAISSILDQDKEVARIGDQLLQEYGDLKKDIIFLRDKTSAHRDISIYGPVHGAQFDQIMKTPETISRIIELANLSQVAIKKIIKYRS